jgi:hypothetical protein
MKATKNGLAIQITTDENEKQKEKLAADQFFSSLLGLYLKRPPSEELGFETLCKGASDTAT